MKILKSFLLLVAAEGCRECWLDSGNGDCKPDPTKYTVSCRFVNEAYLTYKKLCFISLEKFILSEPFKANVLIRVVHKFEIDLKI